MQLIYLEKAEFGLWDSFVEESSNGTIFHKTWLMQTAGPDYELKLLVLKEDDGKICAGIPICIKKRFNYSFVLSPSLISRQGIVFRQPDDGLSYYKILSQQKEMSELLVKELQQYSYFLQNFTVEYQDWQPFMWANFQAEISYTYILKNIPQQEQVWENMSAKLRNTIKKAEKTGIVVKKENNPEAFLALYKKTFGRQGLEHPVSAEIVRHIIELALQNDQGSLYFALDQTGNYHSGAFILHDRKRSYYLLSGSDEKYRSSGSISLLLWEIIKAVSARADEFDFEGSNIPSIEHHFRTFGGYLTPYFKLSKANSKLIGLYKKLKG